MPTNAPFISNTFAAGAAGATNLTLSWPVAYTNGYTNNWRLQAQTNTLAVGLSNNWVNVGYPLTTNRMSFPLSSTNGNGAVFYRMFKP